MTKVCHMTSVHPAEDVRIFQKECVSIAKAGYDVYLVERGESYEKNGVHIVGVGQPSGGRLSRMTAFAKKVYQAALAIDADVYHLHDPELLPYGLKLKRKGKKVIFDSHEDVPADILEKYWVPAPLRKLISRGYARYETYCFSRVDGVIGVTPAMCDRLENSCRRFVMVTNYPIWEESLPVPTFQSRKVAFPGLISQSWCIDTLLRAVESIEDVTVELRSRQIIEPYGSSLRSLSGWKKVNFPGRVSHEEVLRLLADCMCGIALLHECPNSGGRMGTLGNTKIFEYMMVGIPVICTDFILWKQIMDRWDCGICVDPENVDEIAAAISYLLDHPEEARQMGENGRRAVKEEFNWGVEEKKLLALYEEILKG